jgi:hypothetical protein
MSLIDERCVCIIGCHACEADDWKRAGFLYFSCNNESRFIFIFSKNGLLNVKKRHSANPEWLKHQFLVN